MPHQLLLVVITILATSAVALFVIFRNPRSEIARSFVMLISCFVLWAASQGVMYISANVRVAYMANLVTYFAGLSVAWTFFRFAYLFPSRMVPVRRVAIIVLGISSLLTLPIILTPGFLVRGALALNSGFGFPVNAAPFSLYSAVFFAVFGYAYSILVKKYLVSTAENKVLLLHIIYSSLIPVIAGSILSILLVAFNQLQFQIYGPSFTLFFTLNVAYLIFIRSRK